MTNNNGKSRKKDSARLVWDTKPRRAPNPKDIEFQTAEVVIPNPQTAGELPLSFRDGLIGETEIDKQKMNRLIWGDNLLAMQALLAQGYEGKINLIYIDPPFDSKADYSHKLTIEGNEFTKEPSVIERLAYKDTWTGGTDSYLDMLYPRLQLMKRLLSQDGSIYVHLDWHIGHYVKVILDEVFGKENFLNEIVWKRYAAHSLSTQRYDAISDHIFLYAKDALVVQLRPQLQQLSDKEMEIRFPHREMQTGRRYQHAALEKSANRSSRGEARIIQGRQVISNIGWIWSQETFDERLAKNPNLIHWTGEGRPRYKIYADEYQGRPMGNIWDDINYLSAGDAERIDFATQKPKNLLNRIITGSSKEGELVADFFAGSGTTGVVAEKLGRRWIMCELGKVGIQVTRARLVEQDSKPFLIENIGNYQREMIYLTGGRIWEMQQLVLKLYGATPRDKTSGLGVKRADNAVDELIYVGYPDRPITARKAEELAIQAQKLDGRGYKRLVILGWDYEYNYHQALEARLNALKDKLKVKVESRDIPPDIYDYLKRAKSEEDIEDLSAKVHFFERPYLRLEPSRTKEIDKHKVQVSIAIKRYVIHDIPVSRGTHKGQADYEALMKIAKDKFEVLIDYWAVDWDYDGQTFKSQWQAFRGNGKKAKTVPIEAMETLEKKNKRTMAVRVVDIFGNDAAATLEI